VVLLGTFQLTPDGDRVNARFVQVSTGEILVTVKVARPHGPVLALQDEAASAVRAAVPELLGRLGRAP
jgi:TolB-like protein